jgi:ADP-ribose pyrophosphatase YjhB (NUDIX family)
MEDNLVYVVGTVFIRDGKILISMSKRSAKKGKYTLIGGGVEEDETFLQAARRECQEEIGNGFDILEEELEEILVFREPALSDPNMMIEMHMFKAHKDVDVELIPNDEIMEFRWFSLGEDETLVSSAIKDNLIPWAILNNEMY